MKIIRFILAILKLIVLPFQLLFVWIIGLSMLAFAFIAEQVRDEG